MKNKKVVGAVLGVLMVGAIIVGITKGRQAPSVDSAMTPANEIMYTTNGKPPEDENSDPDTPDSEGKLVMTDVEQPDPDQKTYTVTFYNEDGDIVDQQQVVEGESAIPADSGYSSTIGVDLPKAVADASEAPVVTPTVQKPTLTKEGNKFVEWDKPLDNIREDTEVHPVTEEIEKDGTEVYSDAVYVKQGENTAFSLELGSNSEIAVLQLIIKTDSSKLVYLGCQNLDSGVRVAQTEDEVRISFMSNVNVDGTLYLGDLVYAATGNKGTDAEIEVIVDKAVRIDDNEELVNTDVTVSNGIVHIY